jgi:S-phase kinase-associated protein 1
MFTKFAASSPSSSSSSVIEATSIQTVKLQSGDGEIFTVKIEVAMQSKIVKTMIQDLSVDGTQDLDWSSLEAIPLSNVTGPILRKVLTWMDYHQKTDPPVIAPEKDEEDLSNFTDEISEWDGEFVKVDFD